MNENNHKIGLLGGLTFGIICSCFDYVYHSMPDECLDQNPVDQAIPIILLFSMLGVIVDGIYCAHQPPHHLIFSRNALMELNGSNVMGKLMRHSSSLQEESQHLTAPAA